MTRGAPVTAHHVLTLTGAFLVATATSAVMSGLSFVTEPVITQFDLPAQQYAWYFAIMAVAMAFAMATAGRRFHEVGARNLLLAGGVLAAVSLIGMALSFTLVHFYLWAAVLGAGFGLWAFFVPVILVESWVIRSRGLVLGAVLAGTAVGGLLWSLVLPPLVAGPAVEVPLVGYLHGWQIALGLNAAIVAFGSILPAVFLITDLPADVGLKPVGDDGSQRQGLTSRQAFYSLTFILFYPVLFLLGLVQSLSQIVVPWLIRLVETAHLSSAELTWTLMGWSLSLLILKPLIGFLADRVRLRWVLLSTLLCGAVGWVLMPGLSLQGIFVRILVIVLATVALSACHLLPPLMTGQAFGTREFPRIWGLLGGAYLMGNAVGVPLWGFLRDLNTSPDVLSPWFSYNFGFYLAPALLVVAGGIGFWALTYGIREAQRLERVRQAEAAVAAAARQRRAAEQAVRQ